MGRGHWSSSPNLLYMLENIDSGFTLLELIVVVAIIGLLAVVLIPSLIKVQTKANRLSADVVGRNILNSMAHVEVNSLQRAICVKTNQIITISAGDVDSTEVINLPPIITQVSCMSNDNDWQVSIEYRDSSRLMIKSYEARK